MSRGGLLLRCVSAGVQLTYVPLARAARHGARPPKLTHLPRKASRSVPPVALPAALSLGPARSPDDRI